MMFTTQALPMQDVMDVILDLGKFAILVIAVWLAIIFLVSILDRHPRDQDSHDKQDRK